jgi:hypothetical protein
MVCATEKQFAGQTGTLSIHWVFKHHGPTGYEQESTERHKGHNCVTPSRLGKDVDMQDVWIGVGSGESNRGSASAALLNETTFTARLWKRFPLQVRTPPVLR